MYLCVCVCTCVCAYLKLDEYLNISQKCQKESQQLRVRDADSCNATSVEQGGKRRGWNGRTAVAGSAATGQ